MSQGPAKGTVRGHFMSRPVRYPLLCIAILIVGLAGTTGTGFAGPAIVENADTGGGATWPAEMRNQQAVGRLFQEVFTEKKPDVCMQIMAANALNHTPDGVFEGPDGFERFVATVWDAFPTASFAIDDMHEVNEMVTIRWSMAGTHLGDFQGLAATGAPIVLEGIALFSFDEHKISASWIQYDRLSLTGQIGSYDPIVPVICPPCETP
jgi:predicted ester cyclase